MTNEKTTNPNPKGAEADKAVAPSVEAGASSDETKTPSQRLKEENDSLEREMIRAQKIRNEALLAGTAGGHIEAEPAKEETPQDYAKKVMAGEL